MCRLAFYTGPARPLSALLYDAPHALEDQAYRPRQQQHGNVNVDGTGAVWWRSGERDPLRYVTTSPPWSDPNLPALAPRMEGHTLLAAVRGATPGVGFGAGLVAPFLHDGVAFVHNGWIGGFRDGIGAELLRGLPASLTSTITGLSDSVVLFLCVLRHRADGLTLPDAVTAALQEVAAVCLRAGQPATLNVIASDGSDTVAARAATGLPGNSLHTIDGAPGWPDAVLIASEPLDDGPWTEVADDCLVHVTAGRLDVHPLTLEPRP